MKSQWTRGEKLLWGAPILVGLCAVAAWWGPQLARRALGEPQIWTTSSGNSIRSMALSANGEVLAAGGERYDYAKKQLMPGSGTIYLWSARTGEKLPPLAPTYTRDKNGPLGWDVYALAIAPDATKIVFSRIGPDWALYDTATRKLL